MSTKKKFKNKIKAMSEEDRKRLIESYTSNSSSSKTEVKEEILEKKVKSDVNINEDLKSPVVSFMGHVDAGKTSLMDCIRGTKIQDGEAGGITQNIGSSFVPIEHIRDITKNIKGKFSVEHNIPGLLIVDTPGHSAFSSMRDRGSSLCDIAILVVNINEGIQPQTEESIKLLKAKNIPFVVAANKIDMIYGWRESGEINLRKVMKEQDENTIMILQSMMENLKYDFGKLEVDAEFYFKNETPNKTYSIVPICTKTKEGLSDLLSLIVYISQNWMSNKIKYRNKLDATIMESTLDKKLGWVVDLILSNGTLNVGDKVSVTSYDGPKISTIRNIYTPPHLTQDRYKVNWTQNSSIRASQGVRIIGSNLENSIAGSSLFSANENEDLALKNASEELEKFWKSFNWDSKGVYLLAPTIGELDAGYNILKEEKIPIIKGDIGNFGKKVVDKYSTLVDGEENKENRVILYFHSKSLSGKEEEEFKKLCQDNNLTFLHDMVIYHLVKNYNELKDKFLEERKKDLSESSRVIFPCDLQILKDHVYLQGGNGNDLLFGVKVRGGKLLKGSPLISENKVKLGKVISIQKNHKELDEAKLREEVCIRIKSDNNVSYGRHFDYKDKIMSELNRSSINELKSNFREEMTNEDWLLVVDIIKKLDIPKI
tara:strand:- start:98 stop:2062 length:1965 start_codon:yes stop_codon:yes gene_type:complete